MALWKIVRPAAWAGFRSVSRLYLALSGRKYRYVFILGHMRSGSTLLAHILASHPDFAGAGETHISYRTPADLPKLVFKTCELLHKPILRQTYIVDQINHPYVTDEVLRSNHVHKCIILLREPAATLKSLMAMLKCDEKDALEVYLTRLETLAHYGTLLGGRAMLVEYDNFIDHGEETLAALTGFIGLDSPLAPDYSTHRMTGRVGGNGDPSVNIKAGRIIRTPGHKVTLSAATIGAATRAFEKCRSQLHNVTPLAARPPSTEGKLVAALSG